MDDYPADYQGRLGQINPSPLGSKWETVVFTDEVIHWLPGSSRLTLSEYPMVDGVFITECFGTETTTFIRFGPFPTLEAAAAAWRFFK